MTCRLIVDGYNVLSSDAEYRRLAAEDVATARARLVEDVAAWAADRFRATVVFDGGGNPLSDGTPHQVAGVAVVFSPAGTDADSVVEELVLRARRRGEKVTVATSDRGTQEAATARGVVRMSAGDLLFEIREAGGEWRENSSAHTGGRVEDMVDSATREALFRWAQGGYQR